MATAVDGRRSPTFEEFKLQAHTEDSASQPSSIDDSLGNPLLASGDEVRSTRSVSFAFSATVPQPGWRTWCGGRSVTLIKAGASLAVTALFTAVRATTSNPVVSAFSPVGIGVGLQSFINSCFKSKYASRVEQVSFTLAGQGTFFGITQIWENTKNVAVQKVCIIAIGVILGSPIALYGKYFLKNYVFRSESVRPPDAKGPTFNANIFPDPRWDYAKVVSVAFWAVGWYFAASYSMPVLKGIASCLTTYYACEPVAQKLAGFLDKRIEQASQAAVGGLTQISGSAARVAKIFIHTAGFFLVPAVWVAYKNGRTDARVLPLWAVGAILGLIEGAIYRSQIRRYEQVPLEMLDELKERPRVNSCAFRVWQASWPAIMLASLTVFWAFQVASSLDVTDKIAISLMYAGALAASAKNYWIEKSWSLSNRIRLKTPTWKSQLLDRLTIMQSFSRIAGLRTIYWYFLITNSIQLRSGQELDPEVKTAYWTGWCAYGIGMADEVYGTMKNIKGTPFIAPLMVIMNAFLTLYDVANE